LATVFLFFYKFPLPSTVLLLPVPYRYSGVTKYACCVNNFAKTLVANLNRMSYCDVTNSAMANPDQMFAEGSYRGWC